jgi:hypothetical protein
MPAGLDNPLPLSMWPNGFGLQPLPDKEEIAFFKALRIHNSLPQGWYPVHGYE